MKGEKTAANRDHNDIDSMDFKEKNESFCTSFHAIENHSTNDLMKKEEEREKKQHSTGTRYTHTAMPYK